MSGQPREADSGNHQRSAGDRRGRRSGFGAVLAGVMVAGMVSAPPVAGTSPGVPGSAPQAVAAAPAGPPSVLVPLANKKRKPRVAFTSKKRLVVNIDPDLRGKKNWKFKLQRKSTGKWRKVGIYRTRGKSEIRKLKVKKGKYRVKVYARPGYRAKTTKAYRFTPTTPIPPPAPAGPAVRDTTRVSVRSDGGQANGPSNASAVSADGRWITYTSRATDLVDNDTNGTWDVFLFDRDTGLTRRVSVNSNGEQADGASDHPAISADGRWIAYDSGATNLVDDDSDAWDVYLFDRETGATQRVSNHIDGDLQFAGASGDPALSADGRWITYRSDAADLVDNDTNRSGDVFLFDRDTGLTRRVSVRSDGGQTENEGDSSHPAISADGRWITFSSEARNLVDNDTDTGPGVFLFDRDTGLVRRVSVRSHGGPTTEGGSSFPAISGDGRWISYVSSATNLVDNDTNNKEDVFLFDRDTGLTRRVSVNSRGAQANGESRTPAISADGRWITYNSSATNLVNNDTNKKGDVFLFDRDTGLTQRVSVRGDGGQAGDRSLFPAISADGRWITYKSLAANLVDNDTNNSPDVFLARMW